MVAPTPFRPPPLPGFSPPPSSGLEPELDPFTEENSDSQPPSLETIYFEPADAPDGSEVTIFVNASDNLSGVSSASGAISSPSRKVFVPFALSIDSAGRTLTGRLKIPPRSEAGVWKISTLRLTDKARNTEVLTGRDNAVVAGARLSVFSSTTDSTPPQLQSIELNPSTVDDGGRVQVSVRAVDDESRISTVRGILSNPSGSVQLNFYPRLNKATGAFEGTVSLPQHSEYGDWRVTLLTLSDSANNRATISGDDEQLANARVSVSSSSSDTMPPELHTIFMTPAEIEGGKRVVVTATASDDLSGVKGIDGWVVSPNKGARIHFALRASGDSDQFNGAVNVPEKAAAGTWRIDRLSVSDKAGNRQTMTGEDSVVAGATFEVVVR